LSENGFLEAHGKVSTITVAGQSFRIAGFNGCKKYKNTNHFQYEDEEMAEIVRSVRALNGNEHIDLVVSHAPPYGINDSIEGNSIAKQQRRRACAVGPDLEKLPSQNDESHEGFRAFWDLLRAKPGAWMHGHTYPQRSGLPEDRKVCSTAFHYTHGARIVQVGSYNPDPFTVGIQRPVSVPQHEPEKVENRGFMQRMGKFLGLNS
jgi:hypothetical protein